MDVSGKLIARNTALNIGGKAVPLAVGILAIPLIVRGLGEERFGLLSLSWVILNYFTIFDFGLGRATTKYVAEALGKKEYERIPSIVFSAAGSQVIFGMIGAVVLMGLNPLLVHKILNIPDYLIHEASISFSILAFSIPVLFVTSSFAGVLEASQRFDLINLVMIPSVSLTFLLPVVGVWAGFNLSGIMILLLSSRVLVLLAFLALSLARMSAFNGKNAPSRDNFRKLMAFGGWVTVSSVVSPILVYMDRFFLGSFLTLTAVSYYTAPSEIIIRLLVVPTSLIATLFPAFSFLGERNRERLEYFLAKTIKFLAVGFGLVVILVVIFSGRILTLWLGVEFATQSTRVLQILAMGVFMNALARIPFSYLQGLGRPDITAKIHVIELPVHLVMVWFLVGKYGIEGAAAAWTLRMILDAVLLFSVCFHLKITSWRVLGKSGLVPSFVMVAFLIVNFGASRAMEHDLILQVIYAICVMILSLWISWRYMLDAGEKETALREIKRFISMGKIGI